MNIFSFFRRKSSRAEEEDNQSQNSRVRSGGFASNSERPVKQVNFFRERTRKQPEADQLPPDPPPRFGFGSTGGRAVKEVNFIRNRARNPIEAGQESAGPPARPFSRPVKEYNRPEPPTAGAGRLSPPQAQPRPARGSEVTNLAGSNIQTLLEKLKNLDPGVLAVFITSNEGRLTESTTTSFGERVRIGASSAISLAVARKESVDLHLGEVKELLIRSDKGAILLISLGARGILTVVTNHHADPDNIWQESQQVAYHLMSLR